MLAICAVRRTALRYCACGELSLTSGSYWPSADVSVRSMSMPSDAGSCFISRRIGSATGRAAASCDWRSPELGAVRQAAVPQQVADLLERRALREVVNVVAVVRKNAAIAVQITDGRRSRRRRLRGQLWASLRLQPCLIYRLSASELSAERRRSAGNVTVSGGRCPCLAFADDRYLAISGAISSSPVNCWRIDSSPV